MTRGITILIMLLVVVASLETVTVSAGSSKNPYSSYNISGVNYGAQQWEKTHSKSSSSSSPRVRWRRR
ncbi:hypothetical protein NA78x_001349 [Anatilimnocola sp. NA78]|uniref:hypothetical protein n=1 Tax=Anatilimnocola sp. NA78 TaxID=3415683 RepID=UPI003CE510A2